MFTKILLEKNCQRAFFVPCLRVLKSTAKKYRLRRVAPKGLPKPHLLKMGNFGGKYNKYGIIDAEKLPQKYDVDENRILGKGEMGVVFFAEGVKDKTKYAVKELNRQESGNVIFTEVLCMKELKKHDHIVRLADFYLNNTKASIVMEYLDGPDVCKFCMQANKLSETEIKQAIKNLVSALKYCHSKGVAHRDLRPENIILRNKEDIQSVVIIDFGLGAMANESNRQLQRLKTICGDPQYFCPEMVESLENSRTGRGSYSYKCDIWALGVISYILLSGGFSPFRKDSAKKTMEAVKSEPLRFFPEKNWSKDIVSAEAREFLVMCMKKDPEDRANYEKLENHEWMFARLGDMQRQISSENMRNHINQSKLLGKIKSNEDLGYVII